MVHIEVRTVLDRDVLTDVLTLVEETTRIDGHRPVGEHKYLHLVVGASDWTGVLAYDGGRLVGYAHTRWNVTSERPRAAVEVVVHPEWRDTDVAPRLLDETRRMLARAGGGLLYLWVHWVEDPKDTLAYRMGFAIQRELAFMQRRLGERPEPPPPPPGVVLQPFRPGIDDEALLEVNNAAFAGHPENGNWSLDDLRERQALDWFDPDGLLLAWRGQTLLGFHWTKWHGHDSDEVPAHEPVGEVYILGIHPHAQGLGLGRLLLLAGLASLYDRGCRLAVLYVDRASTGAVRLYESAGFEVAYSEVCYEQFVPPITDSAPVELRRPAF